LTLIENIILGYYINDGIEVSRSGTHSVDTWILSFKTKTNKNLTFWMEEKNLWGECWSPAV